MQLKNAKPTVLYCDFDRLCIIIPYRSTAGDEGTPLLKNPNVPATLIRGACSWQALTGVGDLRWVADLEAFILRHIAQIA